MRVKLREEYEPNDQFVAQTYPRRLIEVDLPIKRISAHARREKSIRHGHISTLHIWWARRPLAACRAVICAALWPDPADPLCPQAFVKSACEQMLTWAPHERQKLLIGESRKRFEEAPSRSRPCVLGRTPLPVTLTLCRSCLTRSSSNISQSMDSASLMKSSNG